MARRRGRRPLAGARAAAPRGARGLRDARARSSSPRWPRRGWRCGAGAGAAAQRRRAARRRRRTGPGSRSRTPEGGFRMGNPAAPVKVIEYLSLTCPHCAEFAHEGSAGLMAAMCAPAGSASNIATIILNGLDVAAAVLTRCAAPLNYFAMTHDLLGSQPSLDGADRRR